MLHGLAALRPTTDWQWFYRPNRWVKSLKGNLPENAHRRLLLDRAAMRSVNLFHRPNLFHGLNQRLPLKRFPRQLVTFHDLFVMTAEYSTPEFRQRFTAQARHAAAEADHIIAVSEFTASQVVELLHVPRSSVTVIYHGVRPAPADDHPREKLVLFVGALQKRKNLLRLVSAFRALPSDWRLVLVGGVGFEGDRVLEAARLSGARDRIEITGYVNEEDLHRWYARAALFAFPSLDEGFGLPILEAMAAGVPVLTSSNSALGEIAADAALRVDPTSEEEIAEGLRTLAGNPDLAAQLTQKGRSRAAQFTWEKACSEVLSLYKRIETGG